VAPREELRRRVREVAAIATDEQDFFARLGHAGMRACGHAGMRACGHAGMRVKLRRSSRDPQQVTGYAVGLDGHATAACRGLGPPGRVQRVD
jgi:hypothetical protein